MPWVFDTDSFIVKGEGVFDTDAMIAAIYGTDDTSLAGIRNALYSQQHNFDDFEGQMMNPFVMDAVEMAIKSGQLDKEIGRIIHSGPDTPGYDQAMRQAMRVGKPLVNEAAKRQIEINREAGHGFAEPNLPFVETQGDEADWQLDNTYYNGATSTVNARKEGRRGKGAANPFNAQGQLVTDITSGMNNNREGWFRWYEEGAKELGLVETRYNQRGEPRNEKRFVIPAHLVHTNTTTVNDDKLLMMIANFLKQQQAAGVNPMQAKALLQDQPFMHRAQHMGLSNYDSIHGAIERRAMQNEEIRNNLMEPTTDEDLDAGEAMPSIPGMRNIDSSIIPPDAQDEAWVRWINNHNYGSHNKSAVKSMMDAFDMDEEQAKAIFDRANMKPKDSGIKGNRASRIYQLLYMHEMDKHGGNLPPDHHYTGPRPPLDGRGIEPGQPAEPQPPQPPQPGQPVIPEPAPRNPEPGPLPMGPQVVTGRPPINPRPAPPPINPPPVNNVAQARSTATGNQVNLNPSRFQSLIDQQNGNIPLSESDFIEPTVGAKLSRFAELLGRATRNDIFRRSDEFKNEIETYIEDVQMEMAKTVIEDYHDIRKMDMDNPLDIAILGSRIQRPTNDVLSILHTRGDWRNIAKSFDVSHRDVQLVKVALNE